MIETTEFTLSNGLRVIHSYDPPSAMVAMNIIYNVGSRDERKDRTGMAHLFEHLMFGGSANIPSFDTSLELAGGVNNAWTNNDFTSFYDVVPAVNAETIFWLESDRMLSLAFNEKSLEVQRSVVIEEFKQTTLNRPYGDLMHHLRALAYKDHPYSYPTIGRNIADIEKVTLEDVKEFFYTHYAPNNAVMAVTGDISAEETRRLAEKWFASIPRREIASRLYGPEPPLRGPVRKTVEADVPQTALTIAFRMGGYHSPDYIPADLITDILASGHSSRFYRELLMGTEVFSSVNASIEGSDEPGLLLVTSRLLENSDEAIAEAERLIWEQLERMATDKVTGRELQRAINRYESDNTFSSINFLNRADMLALALIHNQDINALIPAYRAVTPGDILHVSASLFRPENSVTLVYRPKREKRASDTESCGQ